MVKKQSMSEAILQKMEKLGLSQRERLAYIEFRLYFLGDVRRQDLMDRFGVAPAATTRDFSLYREISPNNIDFEGSSKTYILGDTFKPVFEHNVERVLTMLSRGFGGGIGQVSDALLPCELPLVLNRPSANVLAPVTRAIYQKKSISMKYFSHSSGMSKREIVPFALANDGLRWHVRAFDRKSQEFRDFVFTRMESTKLLRDSKPEKHELPDQDIQWNRIVELDIVPHPDRGRPEITERDYGMVDGVLHLKLRAAMAGYVLPQWQVDCSADHSVEEKGCRLWLRDVLALYGVNSAKFTLGYQESKSTR
ncbi:MAG: COGs COG2378 [uncultured Thiotrichaceae bacterium]|uniref:COGs COG2378 n=1 Tax=uncultured Thiotrichaceae bacterium TaxID=298394 RepID=A0A6S6SVA0_9GAMM|nr:MAG: COGs COG2378 [uncultured Thiotrichaceae bacterium]